MGGWGARLGALRKSKLSGHDPLADITVWPHPCGMIAKFNLRDVRNVVGAFLAAYGWVAFFCFVYLDLRWTASTPTSPDPLRGYVFYHSDHGAISYFSAFQVTACSLLLWTSIPLSFIGMLLIPKRNINFRRGFLSFSMKWELDDPENLNRIASVAGALAAPLLVFVVGPTVVKSLVAAGVFLSFL